MNFDVQQIMDRLIAAGPRGLTVADLAKALGLQNTRRAALGRLLESLRKQGVRRERGGRFVFAPAKPSARASAKRGPRAAVERKPQEGTAEVETPPSVRGRIRIHPAGYGFVEREDTGDTVFIPAALRGAALDGDLVAIEEWLGLRGPEARVTHVLARGRAKLTGTLRRERGRYILEPDDPRISSSVRLVEGIGAAREGQVVVAEIVRYPSHPDEPMDARVLQALGDPDDPRTEIRKVIVCADIPDEFSDDALAAARRLPSEVRTEDLLDRVDLRDREFVTIDPENARDFDDAVCVEPYGDGFRLYVAVADVSAYVHPETALDREARARGFSVYLPDRAIPMLPEPLSAGICSLLPEVDRLAMVVRLDIDRAGNASNPLIQAAVIRSRARLDYAGVAAALAGDFRGGRARYRDHAEHLSRVATVARLLRARREARGALDLDLPEATVILDEDDPRRVRDVRESRRSPEIRAAYGMIEDCMVAANEAVAGFFKARGLHTVWRVHAPPTLERLEEFARVAAAMGLHLRPADGLEPRALRRLLLEMRGRPMERPLTFLLLRSLKQAAYDTTNVGHFGLASSEYLHFTSPIRRYPDLVVHRLLKHALRREGIPAGGPAPPPPDRDALTEIAAEATRLEQRAVQTEREVVDIYRAYLMREHVGDEFEGTISAVTSFGLFVEIRDPFVDGFVPRERLGKGPFEVEPARLRLTGTRSGRSFALGDRVLVRVENVSVQRRRIEVSLVGMLRNHGSAPAEAAASTANPREPEAAGTSHGLGQKSERATNRSRTAGRKGAGRRRSNDDPRHA